MDMAKVSLMPGKQSCLEQLLKHCSDRLGLNAQNQVCISTDRWFFHGGQDPLDYIYVFKSRGDSAANKPRHFHYVGFGLTDIHNYETYRESYKGFRREQLPQIFPPRENERDLNGFGFEITFRLKCSSEQEWLGQPPKWPVRLMQDLASFAFKTKQRFGIGDHTAWHCPLSDDTDSRIRHIFMTLDPDLQDAQTSLGPVRFIQLVGVCQEELDVARKFTARLLLDMMSRRPETGGQCLITDMQRQKTIFELDPGVDKIMYGIESVGSDITIINVDHKYRAWKPEWFKEAEIDMDDSDDQGQQENYADINEKYGTVPGIGERGNLMNITRDNSMADTIDQPSLGSRTLSRISICSETSEYRVENAHLTQERYLNSVYLLFPRRSVKLLSSILIGRLAHRRDFTYLCNSGKLVTNFIPEGCVKFPLGNMVSRERPFAKKCIILQVYISDELRAEMMQTLEKLDFDRLDRLPMNLSWPKHKFHITIADDEVQTYQDIY